MMMSSEGGAMSRFPFTASQWQELEHQALIYKYIISGIPVPHDLLFSLKRSPTYTLVDSSSSSKFLSPHSQHVAWSCFQMGMGKKIDPEPGRCRRTDGKKWRCAKEAYPDSKYCERHMHRGKNRSRKHVELLSSSTPSLNSTSHQPPSSHNYFLDPDFRRNRYSYGLQQEGGVDEHAFFAEPSGTMRSFSAVSSMEEPLIMSSSRQHHNSHDDYSYLHLQSDKEKQRQYFYEMPAVVNQQPNKTIHRFFDEEPVRSRDSWDHNKSSTTNLSISIPSSNDFNSPTHLA